jgi:flavodoxin
VGIITGFEDYDKKRPKKMKAIIYASVHHGNTKKVVEAIAKECEVELIDATQVKEKDLSGYEAVGIF